MTLKEEILHNAGVILEGDDDDMSFPSFLIYKEIASLGDSARGRGKDVKVHEDNTEQKPKDVGFASIYFKDGAYMFKRTKHKDLKIYLNGDEIGEEVELSNNDIIKINFGKNDYVTNKVSIKK